MPWCFTPGVCGVSCRSRICRTIVRSRIACWHAPPLRGCWPTKSSRFEPGLRRGERAAGVPRLGAVRHRKRQQNDVSHAKRAIMRLSTLGLTGRGAIAAALLAAQLAVAQAESTLKVALHSDLKIIDPVWTTALISTHHGFMIYDTLFALDEKLEVKPQMVERWSVSEDKLTWTFTLREGLVWHDGAPVTAEDCVASLKRWAARDGMAQKLMSFAADLKATDAKTFVLQLKEPYGLVLATLGKPTSNVPFMMPKRVAETDPNTQLTDTTGSGPFVFKRDEWKPGDKTVYVKFDKYKPRSEPASGLAGGKVANVDRVEWRAISDHQQAINALLAGEIDFIEAPPHDLLPLAIGDSNVKLYDWNVLGNQFTFRPNWTAKPFDNAK